MAAKLFIIPLFFYDCLKIYIRVGNQNPQSAQFLDPESESAIEILDSDC